MTEHNEVLGTAWECEAGTVDVIALAPEGELVFATARVSLEVASGFPEERTGPEERARMEMASASWLACHDVPDGRMRFDIVGAVALDAKGTKVYVRHHIDAFGQARG